jgi:WD40 repeat protein
MAFISKFLSKSKEFVLQKDKSPGRGSGSSLSGLAEDFPELEVADAVKVKDTHIQDVDIASSSGSGIGWLGGVVSQHAVVYDQNLGVLLVGNNAGCVMAYGDNFQYLLPSLSDGEHAVTHLVVCGIHGDLLAVFLAHGSVHLLSLPNLQELTTLDPSWLGPCEITCIHADIDGDGNFVYVGTDAGTLLVLDMDVMDGMRVCDFALEVFPQATRFLGRQALSFSTGSIVAMSISPKNSRFLAIAVAARPANKGEGFEMEVDMKGFVMVYDLLSSKVRHVYDNLDTITCIEWNLGGEVIYCGTRAATVMALSFLRPKSVPVVAWRLNSEEAGSSDAPETGVHVRQLKWYYPEVDKNSQDNDDYVNAEDGDEACLFVLVSTHVETADGLDNFIFDDDDDFFLSATIVALSLSPECDRAVPQLQEILTVPPISSRVVLGFQLVPTCDLTPAETKASQKLWAEDAAQDSTADDGDDGDDFEVDTNKRSHPALLLFTNSSERVRDGNGDGYGPSEHMSTDLRILRLPSTPMESWELESGFMPSPRPVMEVLPTGSTASITCMRGVASSRGASRRSSAVGSSDNKTGLSLANHLLRNAVNLAGVSRVASLLPPPVTPATELATDDANVDPSELEISQFTRRRSTKLFDFLGKGGDFDLEALIGGADEKLSWRLVLAEGLEHADHRLEEEDEEDEDEEEEGGDDGHHAVKARDVLFTGHSDGTIIAWAVSSHSGDKGVTSGKISESWCPLKVLRLADAAVRCIAIDDEGGVLCAADDAGNVAIWELRESATKRGAISAVIDAVCTDVKGAQSPFRPDCLHELVWTRVDDCVSALMFCSEGAYVAVGTISGTIYINSIYALSEAGGDDPHILMDAVLDGDTFGASGEVSSLVQGAYTPPNASDSVNVIFASFASGHVAVICVATGHLVACCPGPDCSFGPGGPPVRLRNVVDDQTQAHLTDGWDVNDGVTESFLTEFVNPEVVMRRKSLMERSASVRMAGDVIDMPRECLVLRFADLEKARLIVAKIKKAMEGNGGGHSLEDDAAGTPPSHWVPAEHQHLVLLRGKAVLTYDVKRFTNVSVGRRALAREMCDANTLALKPPIPGWMRAEKFSDARVISACRMRLKRTDDLPGKPARDFIAHIDDQGCLYLHSIHHLYGDDGSGFGPDAEYRHPYSLAAASAELMEGLVPNVQLMGSNAINGAILPNGRCFVQAGEGMVHTSHWMSRDYVVSKSAGTEKAASAMMAACPPDSSQRLMTRHGQKFMDTHRPKVPSSVEMPPPKPAPKRRSMFQAMGISKVADPEDDTDTPADLGKVFSGTMDERTREELFSRSPPPAKAEVSDGGAGAAAAAANHAMSVAMETRQALMERDEKLKELAENADRFQADAAEYTDIAKDIKSTMRRKTNWFS